MTRALASFCALSASALPSVAFACPMCFSGGNANQSAFLWGSLFMMVVPVATLGTLAYLAWQRIRVADEKNAAGLAPRKPIAAKAPDPTLTTGEAAIAASTTSAR